MQKIPVRGYEGRYLVSEDGLVFSSERRTTRSDGVTRSFKEAKLSTAVNRGGYESVHLYKDGRARKHRVHRIVMLSFKYQDGCEMLDVNHKNGDKLDNRIDNLEWCTRSENLTHKYRELHQPHFMTGKFGELHHRSRKVVALRNGEAVYFFNSLMDADRAGFSASKISLCLSGARKFHRGLTWEDSQNLKPFLGK